MNKKLVVLIIVIILLAVIGGIIYLINQNSTENLAEGTETNNETNNNVAIEESNEINNEVNTEEDGEENTETNETGRTLVVYFSAQGHTEEVANKIAENLGADIFELQVVEEYSSDDLDWTDSDSRVSREYEDESLRDIELVSTTVDNWEEYDTVLIGYPIWWGIAAWPVNSFVEANDFSGKTVIPFCTSSSSGIGQSGELLAEIANGGDWQEGQRFSSSASDSDIASWTDSIR